YGEATQNPRTSFRTSLGLRRLSHLDLPTQTQLGGTKMKSLLITTAALTVIGCNLALGTQQLTFSDDYETAPVGTGASTGAGSNPSGGCSEIGVFCEGAELKECTEDGKEAELDLCATTEACAAAAEKGASECPASACEPA